VNACDSNALLDAALAGGFVRAREGQPADVIIVNTCAVTGRSTAKTRGLVRRAAADDEGALIIVTGCAVRIKDELLMGMPEVDFFAPSTREALDFLGRRCGFDLVLRTGGLDPERTRAFIKVQDGCDSFCSYCVVPYVRGKPQSIALADVMATVRETVARGYREIILSGIHLGQYGKDTGISQLPRLLSEVAAAPGDFRVRLSSIEPLEVTDEVLSIMGSSERFCPHLHLPLQSGSDRILAAMRRPYDRDRYLAVVERAREALNNPAITTDIMVGFPGETEADHAETLDLVKRAGFARAHAFIYSPRPGTAAAAFPDRVAGEVARRRSREVRAAAAATARAYRKDLVGTVAEVLPEEVVGRQVEGFCRRYQRIRFAGGAELIGVPVQVCIIGASAADEEVLLGEAAARGGRGQL
jgi:threonylcarbamoyladenosine tRNA methylthiotransferase MtaB